jgi:hypothetical protein
MLHALPSSYRQRALAQVEALITEAERSLARQPIQAGKTKTRDRLQRECRRLALLHRSREFLLSDEFSAFKGRRRR